MGRSYQIDEVKEKLVALLQDSKTGLSGVEISEKLGINRITMTKYLNIFAAEGLIGQKNVGNVNLWYTQEGTEQLRFPDDYFKIKTKYLEYLQSGSENQLYNLIRNCLHSDAKIPKLMSEIIIPAVDSIYQLYDQGKIGPSELHHLSGIISNSIQILNLISLDADAQKNAIIISADSKSVLRCEAASASFHSDGWSVSSLGDMSSAIDVLFDLDLQKFLSKVWKQKNGIMVIVVFSSTEEGLKFFSEAVESIRKDYGKKLSLVLCGDIGKKTTIKSDLLAQDLEAVLQWSQTVYESSVK